jgi:hypothetical protein
VGERHLQGLIDKCHESRAKFVYFRDKLGMQMTNICGHPWTGSYSRVKMHHLGIGGKGVTVCAKLSMLERSDLLRIQMATDARGTFASQNVMREAY